MSGQSLFRTVGSKERLVDRVVNEIQGLIVAGQLEPGMKLPPERELAGELGVSRTVIRGAVQTLVAKGLLETRPGVGTIVRQVTRDQISQSLSLLVQIRNGGVSFEELHQVRSILEVEIAGLAASQATEADLACLKKLTADMESSQDNMDLFAASDVDFHQTLARATHNPLLDLLLGVIRDLLKDYIAQVTKHLDPGRHVLPYHHQILQKVAAKDVAGARQAMRAHLKQIQKNHEEALAMQRGDTSLPSR